MPIYEYKCWSCGAFFSELQPMSAPREGNVCPKCGSDDTIRVPSQIADLGQDCDSGGGFT